ncbi:(2Fe-2S) ferredoxin domain-containing protein [Enterococcus rivorum]|uniref:(2Fe-2S) ferredoxin domain-containing protein n=1 Tax=Enterococcus rivorum TaxID=762845 RepID=UPI00363EE926
MENWNQLKELRDVYRQNVKMRLEEGAAIDPPFEKEMMICAGTGCISSKSDAFIQSLKEELAKNELSEKVNLVSTGCFGLCAQGPIVIIYPEGVFTIK